MQARKLSDADQFLNQHQKLMLDEWGIAVWLGDFEATKDYLASAFTDGEVLTHTEPREED